METLPIPLELAFQTMGAGLAIAMVFHLVGWSLSTKWIDYFFDKS